MNRTLPITLSTTLKTSVMALEIKTSIVIEANPAKVWDVFSAFETYPDWNTFLTKVEGNPREGNQLNIVAGGMRFSPKVLVYNQGVQFKWIGRLLMPGIFDGAHNFELIDNGDGTTTFIHSELFKGILVPLFKKKLLRDTKAGFEEMNRQLKQRVESN